MVEAAEAVLRVASATLPKVAYFSDTLEATATATTCGAAVDDDLVAMSLLPAITPEASEIPARSNKNCSPGEVTMPLRAGGADGPLACLENCTHSTRK